jgi:membrane protease YdiL (CAAX protease family)
MIRRFAIRFPVLSFVVFSFLFTWAIWLSIPTIAGNDWVLTKIFVGVGIVPGLVAVLLDRLRHGWNEKDFGLSWWLSFGIVFCIVIGLNILTLMDGDDLVNITSRPVNPPGLVTVGLIGSLLSGAIAGFTFASARTSSSSHLNSILSVRFKPVWWLVALLLTASLFGIGIGTTTILTGELPKFPLAGKSWSVWLPYVLRSFLFSFFVVTVCEEPAWRGYLLPELQRRFNPLIATLILGFVWGIWHLPIYFIGFYGLPGNPLINALYFTLFAIMFAFPFTWMFNRTGGVLMLALLLHAANNTTVKILPNSFWSFISTVALAICLICFERMWRKTDPV